MLLITQTYAVLLILGAPDIHVDVARIFAAESKSQCHGGVKQ
jgi:hypothetical protein